jgi:uncharacterized protein YacL
MEAIVAIIQVIGGLLGVWLGHRLQKQQTVESPRLQKQQTVESPVVQNHVSPVYITASRAAVIRDVGVLLLLTALGGVIIATAKPGTNFEENIAAMALSNMIFGTIGFTISGSRITGNRWRHLFIVAVVLWLVSLLNVLLLGVDIITWFYAIPSILVMMGIGGALSYRFNRP